MNSGEISRVRVTGCPYAGKTFHFLGDGVTHTVRFTPDSFSVDRGPPMPIYVHRSVPGTPRFALYGSPGDYEVPSMLVHVERGPQVLSLPPSPHSPDKFLGYVVE
jgi:hypothetical protein